MTTIKTYIKGQYWDEELGQNVMYKEPKPRAYSVDDLGKPPTAYEKAADALDKLAKERVASYPGTTYHAAFKHVLETNPDLKAAYGGTK